MLPTEQATNAVEQELEQVWQELQHTPSYVERYQQSPSLAGIEGNTPPLLFCIRCGFPADAFHQCPQEVA